MTDGAGTTRYGYIPITPQPALGAGQLETIDGPLPNATTTYGYDELGRRISTDISGTSSSVVPINREVVYLLSWCSAADNALGGPASASAAC